MYEKVFCADADSCAFDLQLFLWHTHPHIGSDLRAHLFQISHIDNINHSALLVAAALLFPLLWRLVLITEVSRGLTQFGNPRVPLCASLLRSPLCRAERDPPGLGMGREGVGVGGIQGMAASIGAPCRDAGDGERGGGVEWLQGATGGTEWFSWQRSISLRLWTWSFIALSYTKLEGWVSLVTLFSFMEL